MLLLYHAWASTCSQKVRLCLAEKGLAYEERLLNLRRFEQVSPEFLKISPDGVVPVLEHEGFIVRESTIINVYLDEAFPNPPLRPAGAKGRARVAAWSRFVDEVPTQAVKLPSFQKNLRPALQAVPAAELAAALARMPNADTAARWRDAAGAGISAADLAAAHDKLRATLAHVEAALAAGPWLAGEGYSLADIDMMPFIDRIASFAEYDRLKNWPRCADWHARVRARPAFAAARFVEQKTTLDQPAAKT